MMPGPRTTAPSRCASAASMGLLESTIRAPRAVRRPGSSSFPVTTIRTRGRRITLTRPRRSRPAPRRPAACSRVRPRNTTVPAATSSPIRPTCFPGAISLKPGSAPASRPGVFRREDGIGSGGQRRAGHDPDRAARASPTPWRAGPATHPPPRCSGTGSYADAPDVSAARTA